MSTGLTHFCWHCYAFVGQPAGRCPRCSQEITPPAGTGFDDKLLWALHHPLPTVRLTAVEQLGRRKVVRAGPKLRGLAEAADDPYLAAAATEAVVRIQGLPAARAWLEELRNDAPAIVRRTARRLLEAGTESGEEGR